MEDEIRPVKVKKTFYSIVVKRFFDILLSFLAILILSPLMIILCILELIIHGVPIFYKTKRPGKSGKIFNMYKFRSMTNKKGPDGWLLPEEQRLTKFGKFIRKTSLDELPELFNILKGDMSIIGPRPLLVEYLELYNDFHAHRHCVRPGFACFRIVKTDSKTWTWREQFDNDIWYVEHVSLWVDIRMLFAIVKEVFKASDVRSQDNRAPFTGDNLDETRTKDELDEVKRYDSVGK